MRAPGGGGSGSGSGSAGRARAAAFAAVALVLYLLLFSGGDKASSGGNVERSYEPAAAAAPRAADRDVSVGGGPTAAANTATTAAPPPPIRLDGLDGNLERVAGAEVVWQKPPGGRAKGVLLALHGCSHAATDWFPKGPRCAACLGLPEEVNVTGAALARGLAVVALSSADRDSGCWDAFPGSPDAAAARAVAAALLPREGLNGLPVLALGASSGGAFALALATELPIVAGVVCEIMAMPGLADRAKALSNSGGGKEGGGAGGGGRKFPPTAFIHMPRDGGTAALVDANAKALAELGVPTRVVEVAPSRVTAAWLAAKVPELRGGDSEGGGSGGGSGGKGGTCSAEAVAAALAAAGILKADGFLSSDPRRSRWRDAVRGTAPGCAVLPVAADASALSEALNVAWAAHEIVSEPVGAVLDWLLAQQGSSQGGSTGKG